MCPRVDLLFDQIHDLGVRGKTARQKDAQSGVMHRICESLTQNSGCERIGRVWQLMLSRHQCHRLGVSEKVRYMDIDCATMNRFAIRVRLGSSRVTK